MIGSSKPIQFWKIRLLNEPYLFVPLQVVEDVLEFLDEATTTTTNYNNFQKTKK
jgi:hypothetical protein